MSEWNVKHVNFHTKHSVLIAPNEHMPYIIQLHEHMVSILWANEAAEHLISSYVALAANENKKLDNHSVSIDCGNFATL